MECKAFVVKLLKKLLEKYPVTYSFVRNLSVLDTAKWMNFLCRQKRKETFPILLNQILSKGQGKGQREN